MGKQVVFRPRPALDTWLRLRASVSMRSLNREVEYLLTQAMEREQGPKEPPPLHSVPDDLGMQFINTRLRHMLGNRRVG